MNQIAAEEKKLNNTQAQLEIITGNLRRIVRQIDEAVELKEGYLLEVENLENELSDKRDELYSLRNSAESTEDSLRKAEYKLTDTELLQREAEHQLDNIATTIKTLKRDAVAYVAEKEAEYLDLNRIMESSKKDFSIGEATRVQVLNELNEEISAANEEIEALEEKGEFITKKVEEGLTQLEKKEEEIKELYRKNKEREEELKGMASNYNQRVRILKQREADIDVIARRISKKYSEEYPGRKINI